MLGLILAIATRCRFVVAALKSVAADNVPFTAALYSVVKLSLVAYSEGTTLSVPWRHLHEALKARHWRRVHHLPHIGEDACARGELRAAVSRFDQRLLAA